MPARSRKLGYPRLLGSERYPGHTCLPCSMLDALLAGEREPAKLAGMAKGRMRVKHAALIEAFEGVRFGSQHALLIGGILRHIDFLDAEIAALTGAIATHLAAERKRDDGPAPLSRPFSSRARWTASSPQPRR